MKEELHFSWKDTGDLDIEVIDNMSATLRYGPSAKFVAETLAKFRKKPGKGVVGVETTTYKGESKSSPKAIVEADTENTQKEHGMDNVNGDFGYYSKKLHQQYREGRFCDAASTLYEMACINIDEDSPVDALKSLMLAYYFDISGLLVKPFVKRSIIELIGFAYARSGLDENGLKELYYDTIGYDTLPAHALSLDGSFRVFMYCVLGKGGKITEVISHL